MTIARTPAPQARVSGTTTVGVAERLVAATTVGTSGVPVAGVTRVAVADVMSGPAAVMGSAAIAGSVGDALTTGMSLIAASSAVTSAPADWKRSSAFLASAFWSAPITDCRQLGDHRHRGLHVLHEDVDRVVGGERRAPGEDLVGDDPERVDVHAMVEGDAGGLLRRHVGRRAADEAGRGERRRALHEARRSRSRRGTRGPPRRGGCWPASRRGASRPCRGRSRGRRPRRAGWRPRAAASSAS